jgi:hypothetical protein
MDYVRDVLGLPPRLTTDANASRHDYYQRIAQQRETERALAEYRAKNNAANARERQIIAQRVAAHGVAHFTPTERSRHLDRLRGAYDEGPLRAQYFQSVLRDRFPYVLQMPESDYKQQLLREIEAQSYFELQHESLQEKLEGAARKG